MTPTTPPSHPPQIEQILTSDTRTRRCAANEVARFKDQLSEQSDALRRLSYTVKAIPRRMESFEEEQRAKINPLLDDYNARALCIERSRAREAADVADSLMRKIYQDISGDPNDGSYQQLFAENPHLQALLKRVFAQINTY